MKKRITLSVAIGACLLLGACHKTCTCLGYDMQEHNFTSDEVKERSIGGCSAMRNYPVDNFYSVCNWE